MPVYLISSHLLHKRRTRKPLSKKNKVMPKAITIEGTENDCGLGNAAGEDTEER